MNLTKRHNAYSFGDHSFGQLGSQQETDINRMGTNVSAAKFVKCANNESHGFLLDKEGQVYVYGQNSQGQLGLNHNQALLKHPMVANPFLSQVKDIDTKGQ